MSQDFLIESENLDPFEELIKSIEDITLKEANKARLRWELLRRSEKFKADAEVIKPLAYLDFEGQCNDPEKEGILDGPLFETDDYLSTPHCPVYKFIHKWRLPFLGDKIEFVWLDTHLSFMEIIQKLRRIEIRRGQKLDVSIGDLIFEMARFKTRARGKYLTRNALVRIKPIMRTPFKDGKRSLENYTKFHVFVAKHDVGTLFDFMKLDDQIFAAHDRGDYIEVLASVKMPGLRLDGMENDLAWDSLGKKIDKYLEDKFGVSKYPPISYLSYCTPIGIARQLAAFDLLDGNRTSGDVLDLVNANGYGEFPADYFQNWVESHVSREKRKAMKSLTALEVAAIKHMKNYPFR